jgi:hypothetical protein
VTVRFAGICWGLLEAFASATVIVVVYEPAARPEVAYVRVIESASPVEVPLEGLHDSQAASSLIRYESVRSPEFHPTKLAGSALMMS